MLDEPHDGRAGTLRRMVWVFPDRESTRNAAKWDKAFWGAYVDVARRLGLSWDRHAPEDVTVDASDPARPRVFVAGEPVTPADTLFVTSLYSLPYQAMDVFNQYALYAVLDNCGFYLPSPPYLSAIVNDKLATLLHLKDSPVPPIPTVRIGTGRDLGHRHYEPALSSVTYPAIVKPVGWCSGTGICLVHSVRDLRGVLSLAQGGDTPVVVQPYLGDDTLDFRVHMVDGEPHTVMRRTPAKGAFVANVGSGGTAEYVALPDELTEAVGYFAKRVPIPFLCVDFLYDGERYWFSEIEPDGAIVIPNPDSVPRQHALIEARFRAYRRGHARWLGHPLPKEEADV